MFFPRYALAAALALSAGLAWGQTTQPTQPAREGKAAMVDIRAAQTPSQAVDAYARARSTEAKNPDLYVIFLQKMVDLRVAQIADNQARTLLELQPGNALALSVLAYADAQKGEMPEAFRKIRQAVRNKPDEPFAQEVAGQLVAWYTYHFDEKEVTPEVDGIVKELRAALGGKQLYKSAYSRSADSLKREEFGQVEQPAPSQGSVASPPAQGPQLPEGYGQYPPQATPAPPADIYSWFYQYPFTFYNPYNFSYDVPFIGGGFPYAPYLYYPNYRYNRYYPPYIYRGPFRGYLAPGRYFGRGGDPFSFSGGQTLPFWAARSLVADNQLISSTFVPGRLERLRGEFFVRDGGGGLSRLSGEGRTLRERDARGASPGPGGFLRTGAVGHGREAVGIPPRGMTTPGSPETVAERLTVVNGVGVGRSIGDVPYARGLGNGRSLRTGGPSRIATAKAGGTRIGEASAGSGARARGSARVASAGSAGSGDGAAARASGGTRLGSMPLRSGRAAAAASTALPAGTVGFVGPTGAGAGATGAAAPVAGRSVGAMSGAGRSAASAAAGGSGAGRAAVSAGGRAGGNPAVSAAGRTGGGRAVGVARSAGASRGSAAAGSGNRGFRGAARR